MPTTNQLANLGSCQFTFTSRAMRFSVLMSVAATVVPLATLSCGAQSEQAARSPGVPSPWIRLSENPQITTSLDTTRVSRVDNVYRIWMGFDLAEAWPPIEEIKAPYRHYETEQDIDCERRRTRGRAMRIVDVNGTIYDTPSPDSTWQGFAEHPLSENAFMPVCAALASLRR